ncbi:MAG: protein kinase [Desulfobacteraceae bacterium]|nr:protein kinase [Desulfobacteraceae bacterium]MBC2755558.1 protein kinase [Desulfobacteraceae bacterium]
MDVYEWIEWMHGRPNRKARQRRLFGAIDHAMPNWEKALKHPAFQTWASWKHPVTNKTRLEILITLSLDNFDGLNTARLIKISQQEIDLLHRYGTLYLSPNDFLGHSSIIDNRYEVMRSLGMGGFGIVSMVYSHEIEEFLALKTIRDELLTDLHARTQFIQEADLWVNLGQHKHIVHAEFIDKIGDEVVILMELVEPNNNGLTSLQDYISNSANIPIEQIVNLCVGICEGLSHAYSMGIKAHRDLKPDNILIENGSVAKVTDFGISSLTQSTLFSSDLAGRKIEINQTTGNAIMGTLPYMAPEQFLSAKDCDERSDIYSFGIILYQLISKGRWPYGDISSLMKKVAKENVLSQYFHLHSQAKPKFLFHKLFKITKDCLQKEPHDRPQSFQHIKRMLLEAIHAKNEIDTPIEEEPVFDPWETGRKAASLLRLGRYEEALELFDEILKKFPLGVQWEFDKALTLSKLGRDDGAFDLYSKILDRDPTDLGALVNKGLLCQKSGDLTQAAQLLSTALEYHPDDINTLINLGNIAYKLKKFEAASQYYTRTVDLDSGYATGWYNLGLSFRALGLVGESNQSFTNFLQCSDPLDSRREYVMSALNQSG